MLAKILNFYKSNKYVVWWTIAYFFATWAIMRFMFDFDIFSSLRWHQLMHAHLRGFPGFVFGILILAAVPMYIATTIVIAQTNAPLFTIKIPEFIKKAFQQTPMEQETTNDAPLAEDTPQPEVQEQPADPVPQDVPTEMRVAYMRAMEHISRTPVSAFDLGNVTNPTKQTEPVATETEPEPQDMPIPTDFDIDDVDNVIDSVPQFTDINFDDDDDETEIIDQDFSDIQNVSDTAKDITRYLDSQSVPYIIDDDIVVTDKLAIVAHTDPDFWVVDNENWFAAGKTRPSPIKKVVDAAIKHNVHAVLYLGAENIMDIENLRAQWQEDNITVITDLKDLI